MSSTRKKWAVGVALVALTLIAYAKVKDHSFVSYDDDVYVTNNARVQGGLSAENILWAFTSTEASNWHPLTWISHLLDCQVYGLDASGHLMTNPLIHSANALLLLFSLHAMTGALWRSAAAAALFALHPLNVESVAWVAERKNVLSTLLMLAALLAYIRYARKPGWKRYAPVMILFALGLMAKPMLVTLPFALLLLDYWPLARFKTAASIAEKPSRPQKRTRQGEEKPSFPARTVAQLAMEKIPLMALSIASSVITVIAQSRGGALRSTEAFPLMARISNALVSYAGYLRKLVWPSDLAVFYPHPLDGIPLWQSIMSAAALAAITAAALYNAKRSGYLIVGWLWYLGTLVPVIGLVQVGLQSMADRYAYVPLTGIFIAAVWGMAEAAKRLSIAPSTIAIIGVAAIAAFLLVTRNQLEYWANSVVLFERAASVTENNYVAHNNLGEALANRGRTDEAAKNFIRAIEIKEDFAPARLNLGMALVDQGNLDAAIEQFDAALEINPSLHEAYNRRGAAQASRGRTQEAIESFSKALEINPGFAPALVNLGIALDQQGRSEEAIDAFTKALQLRTNSALASQAHYRLANLILKKGDTARAASHYREALRLKPDFLQAQQALNRLGNR
jgi:tetratricopeptide (TPR) repeat protein